MRSELTAPQESTLRPEESPTPALELVICFQDEIRCVALPERGDVSIGRGEGNQIRLDYPTVSRQHALLRLGDKLSICDLGGSNGTFVRDENDTRTKDQTLNLRQLVRASAPIAVGDSIVLGSVTLVIRRRAASATPFGPAANAPGSKGAPIVRSRELERVFEQAERAAKGSISVIVLGETGVGKEVLARTIHARSPRAAQPFIAINCAALSESLLEGELFGYERGAFTGAVQARAGLFEAADGGSVFLDELGELSLSIQAKLLRVLEERAVMRLGARSTRKVDLRFIAATNRNLEAEVAAGRFRQDLYFRLNGIQLVIPPLRERREEIEALVHSFVLEACAQLDRPQPVRVSPEVMRLLQSYCWPGNIRELRNVVERAVILCGQSALTPADLPSHLVSELSARSAPPTARADAQHASQESGDQAPSRRQPMREEIRTLERDRIVTALGECGGNQTLTAKLLGISRRTLTTRLAEFALPRPRKPRDVRG